MPVKTEFKITGFAKLNKNLQTLKKNGRDKASKAAVRKAVNIIENDAISRAELIDDPATARQISKNIRSQFASKIFKRTGNVMYRVGVSYEKGRIPKGNPDTGPGGNTPHWHLIELGTEKSRAHPFIRPALEQNINEVFYTLQFELEREIIKGLI